jgi:beta-fructofuranosidase
MSDLKRSLLFYTPDEGQCGDFIPFFHDGTYHLFYIRGRDWWHISTRDLVTCEEHGVAIANGGDAAQDAYVYTGCVFGHEGLFHIFYTGHNPEPAKHGLPCHQATLHATSEDLVHWHKDPDFRIIPDLSLYHPNAWRDPHVYRDPSTGTFRMVITAALPGGEPRKGCPEVVPSRGGCTALLLSDDLKTWRQLPPIYAPMLYDTHECPDLFQVGDWWYLIFSVYSEQWVTRYRMARSPEGPWIAPPDDQLDGRAFYAAKTALDPASGRRILFGWACIKDKNDDNGKYQWSGALQFHELGQRPDGTLTARLPREVSASFSDAVAVSPRPIHGIWETDGGQMRADATGRMSCLDLGSMPDPCLVEAEIDWKPGTHSFGIMLRVSDDTLASWCQARVEPGRGRVVFDRSNRYFHDQSFVEERPVQITPGKPVRIRVHAQGSLFAVYVNDETTLTARNYEAQAGNLALFVSEGDATFRRVRIRTRAQ